MTYSYAGGFVVQGLYFVLLARILGVSAFGSFAGALALVSALAPFATLGSGHMLLRATARDTSVFGGWRRTTVAVTFVTGGLLSLLVIALALTWLRHSSLGGPLPALALAELLCMRFVEVDAQCFQAYGRVKSAAKLLVGSNIVRLLAVGGFLFVPGAHSATTWSLLYLAAALVAAAAGGLLVRRNLGPGGGALHLRSVLHEGIYFSLGVASKSVYADIDKTMLSRLSTASATGIYTAAYRVLSMSFAPVLGFLYAANARMFKDGQSGLASPWRFARRILPGLVGYAVVLGILLFACSPLLPIILGSGYSDASNALRWLAFLPVCQAFHFLLGDVLMGANRQKVRSLLQLYAAGFNILINLLLIPRWSWRGAAVASYLTEGQLAALIAITVAWSLRQDRTRGRHRRLVEVASQA